MADTITPPHIVIDARELRTSSGRYVERLLHHLQTIDREHRYSVLLKPQDMPDWQASNPNFRKLACPHKEFSFDEQLGLRRQIAGLGADLVHFPYAQQPIWYGGRTVTTIQDLTTLRFDNPAKNRLVFRLKRQVYRYVIQRVTSKSAQLITPSQFVKDDLARLSGVNPAKITVTHEAADPITVEAEPLIGLEGQQLLMYVGRPTPHKNLERLIEAFIKLRARHPDLILVLAGRKDANYDRLETGVRRRTIKNIFFSGFVSEGQLRWLYENCAAYVFPSLSEGFGLPGLEAMVHGAPVVASNTTCLPEIYGDAARYFNPLDTSDMSEAINQVLTDEDLRAELIQKGRRQAEQYSWQKTAEQTLAVYTAALAGE